MKQKYENWRPSADKIALLAKCDAILQEYINQGFTITVRTLYYQMVARDYIPNTERSYKNLTGLVERGRMAGLLDWDVIEDRGRRPLVRPHWESGKDFLESVAPQYYHDMWAGQKNRVFVVVEKDALAGVLEAQCRRWDVPLLAAKGYPSASAVRDLVRFQMMPHRRQSIVMLHLGDHDPSGIDMSRDLEERLNVFAEGRFMLDFRRLALNMEQIEELQPPPNPAKVTDSRFLEYAKEYGDESWELDALSPRYLNDLVESSIREHLDEDQWADREEEAKNIRAKLLNLAGKFRD